MKKMIRMMALTAVMFLAVSAVAEAQGGGGGGGRGRGGFNIDVAAIVKDSLGASADVAAKADSIWKAYQTQQQGLMEAARGGDADAMQKMRDARTKATDAIKALLTDEQKTKFDALVPAGGRGRRGGGAGGAPTL